MRSKRFRTRRLWLNTMAWTTLSMFFMIVAAMFTLVTDRADFVIAGAALVVAGLLITIYRDRAGRCTYVLEGDRLVLRNGNDELPVPLDRIRDMSLLGRSAAREYFEQRLRTASEQGMAKKERESLARSFVRFCPVDIGMRSWSMGLGRRMIDRMASAQHDLVLLRLVDGTDHLLAPVYHQDMIAAVDKARSSERRA